MTPHESQIEGISASLFEPQAFDQPSHGEQRSAVAGVGLCTPDELTVLWIDDLIDDNTVRLLTFEGLKIECATTGTSGLVRARSNRYDAYIIDLQLPDVYGLTVLDRLISAGSQAPALVLTGWYMEDESEKLARQLGAADFRSKPIAASELAAALRAIVQRKAHVRSSARTLARSSKVCAVDPAPRFGIVGVSPAMQAVIEWIESVGPTRMPVLLTGETGTGKELVAKALHERSGRHQRPFVPINCSAIPEGLLETELFGHRRGTFTGAFKDKKGLFEEAVDGTLFLDEIADMGLPLQSRLLRFLEDGELRRVGDTRSKHIDVRIVAATNRSLVDECARGRFRHDLYFRLAVARRYLPSLRERPEDIDLLVRYFLVNAAEAAGKPAMDMTADALRLLKTHPWPGNVRELRNIIEYAVTVTAGDQILEQTIASGLSYASESIPRTERDVETRRTIDALQENRWNRTRTARSLGIHRTTLWRRLRKHGIE